MVGDSDDMRESASSQLAMDMIVTLHARCLLYSRGRDLLLYMVTIEQP